MDAAQVGGLGGTYGGNPVALAAARAVLDIFAEEGLLARAEALGAKLRARFDELQRRHEMIGDVRGLGPMLALELVRDRATKEPAGDEAKALVKFCVDRGLIILSCGHFGNVIRTLMPLVITDEQLERGLGILSEGLETISRK
jgi:4-aminobutyrate aminotransferase/(S)-3-amino-2-methylpropionate transaminase